MACAAIEAVIEAIESREPARAVRRVGAYIRKTCIVGPGDRPPGRGPSHRACAPRRPAKDVQRELLERNILAGTSGDPNILRLLSAFILEEEHVDLLRDALRRVCPDEALPGSRRLRARGDRRAAGAGAAPAGRSPSRRRWPARSSACCSSTPRCARWPPCRPAWRASAAAPSSSRPARAPTRWRRELGAVMNGAAAEHVREGLPVLASYCDALGIRAFAEGKDLEADLSETTFNAMAAAHRQAADQSRVRHEPSLPGARGLEDHG